jgi:hypothetical protein
VWYSSRSHNKSGADRRLVCSTAAIRQAANLSLNPLKFLIYCHFRWMKICCSETSYMHMRKNVLVIAILSALPLFTGCVETPPPAPAPQAAVVPAPPPAPPQEVMVTQPPPPPRTEVIVATPGPGYYWVPGYWAWNGRWVWVGGVWRARPYPHAVWVGSHWVHHGHGYVWVRGYWH